mgnify:CR=1 FL=1
MKNIKSLDQFINENVVKTSSGLAIVFNGTVLLAHTTGRNFKTGYGIPKGGIEVGETNIDAAIREVEEEIGVKVSKNMITSNSYQFIVDSKWGKKIVHYFIVEIKDLSDIGLKEPKIPKSRLQLEEINDARFLDLRSAQMVIMHSQIPVIDNLQKLGLLK